MNTHDIEPMKYGGAKSDDYVTGWNDCYAALEADRNRQGEVVVTKTPEGEIIAVTRQDDEGKILSVIAEADRKRRGEPFSMPSEFALSAIIGDSLVVRGLDCQDEGDFMADVKHIVDRIIVLLEQPPESIDNQALIAFGKYIAGQRPGEDGWSKHDQQVYDAALQSQDREALAERDAEIRSLKHELAEMRFKLQGVDMRPQEPIARRVEGGA